MDEVFQKFLDGDDVPTLVGTVTLGTSIGPIEVASIVVDYSAMNSEQLRSNYDGFMEELWQTNFFDQGLTLTKTSDRSIRVESRDVVIGMSTKDGEQNYIKAPAYYTDCNAEEEYVRRFYELAAKQQVWILHIRTTQQSYLLFNNFPSGEMIAKQRHPKIEFRLSE